MRKSDAHGGGLAVAELEELRPAPAGRVSIATFTGIGSDERFLIELSDGGTPMLALSTIALAADDEGAKVVVAYEDGDLCRPIIIGRLRQSSEPRRQATVDGERLVIRAEREIELRCGDASIVLTRAGKILIRGNYVLTRARGANKIKGAYVDIN